MPKYVRKSRPRRPARRTKRIIQTEVKKYINRNSETKVYMTAVNESSLNTLSQLTAWDPVEIQQGSGNDKREGDEIRVQGFHIKGVLHNNSTSVTNYVRLMVIKTYADEDFTSTALIFEGGTGVPLAVSSRTGLQAMYYPMDKSKCNMLYDRVFRLGEANGTDGTHTRFFNKFIKLHNQKLQFQGSGTGADNLKPRYHIIAISAESPEDTTTGETVEISFLARVWFKDL